MLGGSNFKSFCMVALLVAQATQGVTPDTDSLASSRLFQIVAAIAERGESRANHCLHGGCLAIHTEQAALPNGSAPFEDRSEESAPDEVCLASYELASELTDNEAGYSPQSQFVPFDLALLSVHSNRAGSSCASLPVPFGPELIRSLCRMTC